MDATAKQPNRTVLIVEDNPVWQRFFSELVAARGFDVVSVRTSAEAAAAWNRCPNPPRLVIADVALDDGADAGLEFAEAVAGSAQPPRCIVVTSHGTVERRRRAATIGALFLLKGDLTRRNFAATLAPLLAHDSRDPAPPIKSKRAVVSDRDGSALHAWWLIAEPT
jgi:ActR/RegA family two-component response regulator